MNVEEWIRGNPLSLREIIGVVFAFTLIIRMTVHIHVALFADVNPEIRPGQDAYLNSPVRGLESAPLNLRVAAGFSTTIMALLLAFVFHVPHVGIGRWWLLANWWALVCDPLWLAADWVGDRTKPPEIE